MQPDLFASLQYPWGAAGVLLALLAPRILLRQLTPFGMQGFGKVRLLSGYFAAILLPVLVMAIADELRVKSWPYITPVRSASDLMAVSGVSKYLLATLLAWGAASLLVAPLAACLATFSLANGLLLLAVAAPLALALGLACWFAWPDPSRTPWFCITGSCLLLLSSAFGFAVGAKLPLSVRQPRAA